MLTHWSHQEIGATSPSGQLCRSALRAHPAGAVVMSSIRFPLNHYPISTARVPYIKHIYKPLLIINPSSLLMSCELIESLVIVDHCSITIKPSLSIANHYYPGLTMTIQHNEHQGGVWSSQGRLSQIDSFPRPDRCGPPAVPWGAATGRISATQRDDAHFGLRPTCTGQAIRPRPRHVGWWRVRGRGVTDGGGTPLMATACRWMTRSGRNGLEILNAFEEILG